MAQNLSQTRNPDRMGIPNGPVVQAGTWWRLDGDKAVLPSRGLCPGALPPEEPLTLLVTEVRIHDCVLHSIHVGLHPSWGEGTIKFLAEEFLSNFVEEASAVAEARRERELAALMGRTQEIASLMSRGPQEEEVLAISHDMAEAKRKDAEKARARRLREAAAKKAAAAARANGGGYNEAAAAEREAWRSIPDRVPPPQVTHAGNVPAALLPSGDVMAAQERLQSEITRMEATQKWIAERAGEMTETMRVVGIFQKEKVSAVTAGISDRTRQAHDMLAKVQTMKLFLGDDVKVWDVAEGDSAAPGERLHLMQSMLYLDEELLVEGMFGEGFRHSDLHSLPEILAEHPSLVQRMMPHPRCVAISRVRRESAGIQVPTSGSFHSMLKNVMAQLAEQEADKRIFILIRDGDNVRVGIADEQTSHAERLFPSKAEIDGIYAPRWTDKSKREISPQDIEYSDRRNAHDSRALFYKRFLIMLWGLHEREGAFGPFMPKGMNWLEESIASDRFVFVHDEENVLTDGKEAVMAWLRRGHDDLRPGSEVLVDTRLAMTEDFAPTAWKEERLRDGTRSYLDRKPTVSHLRATVVRQGQELVVQVPTLQGWKEREIGTPLILRNASGETPEGVLNLGTATAETVRRYMGSRLERKNYLKWFGLFHTALPILEERRRAEKSVLDHVMAAGVAEEPATRAIALFRETVRGNRLPQTDAEVARVTLNARAIAAPGDYADPDVLALRLKANGRVVRLRNVAERDGIVLRALEREEDGQRTVEPFTAINPRGEALILGSDALRKRWKEIETRATPGIVLPDDLAVLETINDSSVSHLLADEPPTEAWALQVVENLLAVNAASRSSRVQLPRHRELAGAIVVPTTVETRQDRNWGHPSVEQGATILFTLSVDLMARLVRSGYAEIARSAAASLVRRESVGRLMQRWSEQDDSIRLESRLLTGGRESSRIALIDLKAEENGEFHRLRRADDESNRRFRFGGAALEQITSDDPILELGLRAFDQHAWRSRQDELLKMGRDRIVVFGEDALLSMHERLYPAGPLNDGPCGP